MKSFKYLAPSLLFKVGSKNTPNSNFKDLTENNYFKKLSESSE